MVLADSPYIFKTVVWEIEVFSRPSLPCYKVLLKTFNCCFVFTTLFIYLQFSIIGFGYDYVGFKNKSIIN